MSKKSVFTSLDFSVPSHTILSGTPEGLDAFALVELLNNKKRNIFHIALDVDRMSSVIQSIAFFDPHIKTIVIPPWDCQPYDRMSPNSETSSARLNGLCYLASMNMDTPALIAVTTLNACLQRVPSRNVIATNTFYAEVGSIIDIQYLTSFLQRNGYQSTGTVREPGEFAVRGGIIDIFSPGNDQPYRLDLFGDELEAIRVFDPLTQREVSKIDQITLRPISEILLDKESIARFRGQYGSRFGVAAGQKDPLYQSISGGRRHIGMEHWLPLFHIKLETLFDYLPDAFLTLDHKVTEALDKRLESVLDYYVARKGGEGSGSHKSDTAVYHPLHPEELYLDRAEWNGHLITRTTFQFSPFKEPLGPSTLALGGKKAREFSVERLSKDLNLFDELYSYLNKVEHQHKKLIIAAYSSGARDRLANLLTEHGVINIQYIENWQQATELEQNGVCITILPVDSGFETEDLLILTEQDILGQRLARPPTRARKGENFIAEASALSSGDLVVHREHGIGRYSDLITLSIDGAQHDCLLILYEGNDKLYIPVENIEIISRYGSEGVVSQLDKLGGSGWQARKARAKKRIRDIADQLIRIAASRTLQKGEVLIPPVGLYDEFCANFPFSETEDQEQAIEEVLQDLASGRPMDRLICGDVGFGKTEVALRSAFVAVMSGKQVAVVAPTTLLVRQHFLTFCERFEPWPIKVGRLSRMVNAKEISDTKEGLQTGRIDIVIGTHALLAKNLTFHDLGLIIVDEEQHFGVAQKERLKALRSISHVLTLTATPIPRTLYQALSGVRELSLITTPPLDRFAVRTFVTPFDYLVIREALMREHYRGGQTFYVCPRILDLKDIEKFLTEYVPEVRFGCAHGQMPINELDSVINSFYEGRIDVLLCTNIVESGLDIPTANTIIIHRSDMFGLAQLYQLRGRIGRSKIRGYAYLTLPARRIPTPAAEKRLEVMQALDGLGAGFSLASHDLDIRGAGNLLGEEQSGNIREVGVELYQEMLEEAVALARGDEPDNGEKWVPQINIGTSVLIPERYIADLDIRLGLYRRLSRMESRAEIEAFAAELIDRFGALPDEVENLLRVVAIKQICRLAGVERIEAGPKGATFSFHNDSFANPVGLVEFISQQPGTIKLRSDHRLVCIKDWTDSDQRLNGVMHLLRILAKLIDNV